MGQTVTETPFIQFWRGVDEILSNRAQKPATQDEARLAHHAASSVRDGVDYILCQRMHLGAGPGKRYRVKLTRMVEEQACIEVVAENGQAAGLTALAAKLAWGPGLDEGPARIYDIEEVFPDNTWPEV